MKKANKRAIHRRQPHKRRDQKKQTCIRPCTNNSDTTEDESYLITACKRAMQKPIGELEVEDVRILIGQSINLDVLISPAIEILKKNILAEGDYCPGDLLNAVLTSDPEYWRENKENWYTVVQLYTANQARIDEEYWGTHRILKRNFENFQKLFDDEKR